jgi:hypothetical protein
MAFRYKAFNIADMQLCAELITGGRANYVAAFSQQILKK